MVHKGLPGVLVIVLALGLLGCSTGSSREETGDSEGADGVVNDIPTDGRGNDYQEVREVEDHGGVEQIGDIGPDSGEVVAPQSCGVGADCATGLCVTWPGGSRCTLACGDGCSFDEECRVVPGVVGAEAGVCVPRFFSHCAPCGHSSDCRADLKVNGTESGSGAGCVEMGDGGNFCGANCQLAGCPEGYVCEEVMLAGGGQGNFCVVEEGECGCSDYAGLVGKKTGCRLSNEHGVCEGTRRCEGSLGAWTLGACDGKSALPEACNGEDDDCDGEADEGWSGVACSTDGEFGTCTGIQVCNGGTVVCGAKTAAQEVCDGEDNDCDGGVDEEGASGCQEYFYDSDGDGVGLGMTKCLCAGDAPFTALVEGDCNDYAIEVFPGAAEKCDTVDNNCSLSVDEGCDDDQDGYCDGAFELLGAPQVCSKGGGDCDDESAAVYPGQTEKCDGVDNGCYGGPDMGCDVDGDGWCAEGKLVVPGAALCVNGSGDCDDGNAGVNPGNGTCETCFVGQRQVDSAGCGECQGKVRECIEEDVWGPYSECQGVCGQDEFCVYGLCKPCLLGMKQTSSEGCEPCHEKKRSCGANGEWLDWGVCQPLCVEGQLCHEGACVECLPGSPVQVDSLGCAPINCQKRTRSCLATGVWSAWSSCQTYCSDGLVCYQNTCVECRPTDPAQTSTEGCDSCSTKQRYCNGATLKWGPWTECLTKCVPGKICDQGQCKDCVPYTEQQVACGCGYSVRYCLPDGTWGAYSDCETYCAVGFTCDQGKDCYVTKTPIHAYAGQAFCGYGEEEGVQVSVFCEAGEFCAGGLCRMYQYRNPGTQYTPYPSAGGGACGTVTPDGVPTAVFCLPGDTCVSSYCVRS